MLQFSSTRRPISPQFQVQPYILSIDYFCYVGNHRRIPSPLCLIFPRLPNSRPGTAPMRARVSGETSGRRAICQARKGQAGIPWPGPNGRHLREISWIGPTSGQLRLGTYLCLVVLILWTWFIKGMEFITLWNCDLFFHEILPTYLSISENVIIHNIGLWKYCHKCCFTWVCFEFV